MFQMLRYLHTISNKINVSRSEPAKVVFIINIMRKWLKGKQGLGTGEQGLQGEFYVHTFIQGRTFGASRCKPFLTRGFRFFLPSLP